MSPWAPPSELNVKDRLCGIQKAAHRKGQGAGREGGPPARNTSKGFLPAIFASCRKTPQRTLGQLSFSRQEATQLVKLNLEKACYDLAVYVTTGFLYPCSLNPCALFSVAGVISHYASLVFTVNRSQCCVAKQTAGSLLTPTGRGGPFLWGRQAWYLWERSVIRGWTLQGTPRACRTGACLSSLRREREPCGAWKAAFVLREAAAVGRRGSCHVVGDPRST